MPPRPLLANFDRGPVLQVKVEVGAMHVVGLGAQYGREDRAGAVDRQPQKLASDASAVAATCFTSFGVRDVETFTRSVDAVLLDCCTEDVFAAAMRSRLVGPHLRATSTFRPFDRTKIGTSIALAKAC